MRRNSKKRSRILIIDVSDFNATILRLDAATHTFGALNLSENLLIEIKKFLKKQKTKLADLAGVEVVMGEHFSRTRTAVATANALIFSLHLKQGLIKPIYNRQPNITWAKNKL